MKKPLRGIKHVYCRINGFFLTLHTVCLFCPLAISGLAYVLWNYVLHYLMHTWYNACKTPWTPRTWQTESSWFEIRHTIARQTGEGIQNIARQDFAHDLVAAHCEIQQIAQALQPHGVLHTSEPQPYQPYEGWDYHLPYFQHFLLPRSGWEYNEYEDDFGIHSPLA